MTLALPPPKKNKNKNKQTNKKTKSATVCGANVIIRAPF
jgi:hypothetical protein